MIHHDHVALVNFGFQYLFRNRIFDVFLNSAVQGTGTILRIIAFLSNIILRFISNLNFVPKRLNALEQFDK